MEKFMLTIRTLSPLFILITALALPGFSAAQEAQADPLLVVSHCMKSKSPGYVDLETDMWLPMQQNMVDQGQKVSWSLYRVMYGDRSKCDYYVVETYLGGDQFNANPELEKVFNEVHASKNFEKAMAKTDLSRNMAESHLYVTVDAVNLKPFTYATVNWMQASDPEKYVSMEKEVWKPVHQALTDAGHRAGWGLYGRISPGGSSVGYNYATVDFFNKFEEIPMEKIFKSVHPKIDMEKNTEQMLAMRDHVYSQTWMRVAGTTRAAKKD
mgnify:CR=1 FL=1